MSADGVQWFLGVAFGLATMIGGFIVRDRQVMQTIKDGDDKLHDRISKVRDEYVRRDDLQAQMTRLNESVSDMREEQRETNRRIDAMLSTLTKNQTH